MPYCIYLRKSRADVEAESRGAEPVKGASGRAAAASGHKADLSALCIFGFSPHVRG